MVIKAIVFFIMIVILTTLGSGLYYLIRGDGEDNRTVKALSWRIGISFVLFLLLFIAYFFGLIAPHGLGS